MIGFATYASWGTHIENTLNVFISDSFEGLALDNFTADSTAIAAHAWTDISGSCNLPVSANVEKTADFSLDNYKGKKVVLAFRYKPEVNTDWQPGWEIRNLQINNVLATDGSVFSTFLAANLSFSPFDMLNPADPYNGDASLSGIWIVEDPTRIQLKRTARGYDLNHDWLVSRPFTIPSGFVEESDVTPVKNISSNVGSYAYTFSNTGEYTLRFKASNYNYKSHSSVEKTMVVKITE